MVCMTTSPQNRQPQGIPSGGQFATTARTEPTLLLDPALRPVTLAPGDGEDYTHLADGDVIESLNVQRSHADDGAGYWVTAAKTINVRDLITDTDPRLHGDHLDAWLDTNRAVVEDLLASRYDAYVTVNDEWDDVGVECSTLLPSGPLTEGQVADAAWNATRVVALHNESDHGTSGSENLGRILIERVEASTVLPDPYTVRAAAMRLGEDELTAHVDTRHGRRSVNDTAAVAIARQLGNFHTPEGVSMYPAAGRLASRGYTETAALDLELDRVPAAGAGTHQERTLARRIDSLRTWIRHGGDNA